ncbi:MAG: hypothetical protein QXS20_02420 [Candidatus Thorarchaeota archaeon]
MSTSISGTVVRVEESRLDDVSYGTLSLRVEDQVYEFRFGPVPADTIPRIGSLVRVVPDSSEPRRATEMIVLHEPAPVSPVTDHSLQTGGTAQSTADGETRLKSSTSSSTPPISHAKMSTPAGVLLIQIGMLPVVLLFVDAAITVHSAPASALLLSFSLLMLALIIEFGRKKDWARRVVMAIAFLVCLTVVGAILGIPVLLYLTRPHIRQMFR